MARLSLALLGPPQITLDENAVTGFTYNKARALLFFLAVEAGRPHPRDTLTGLLWPDLPDSAARTNLRQALANLREAVGPTFLLATRDTLQFNPRSDFALDLHSFDALWDACQAHPHRRLAGCRACVARLEEAAALYRGDFLSGFAIADSAPFEEWALLQRERLRQRVLDAFIALSTFYERRGQLDLARRYAGCQLDLDPWREETHRQVMRLLALTGQRSAALAQYEICKRVLAEALHTEPTPETTLLYERIRDGKDIDPAAGAEAHRQLPASPTPIVGRERELAELSDLLANPSCRLITIAGPGGIGKTRLALEAVGAEQAAFAHGAAFVPLAGLGAAEFIAPSLMGVLNVSLQGQTDPVQALLAYLHDKELLLVLDNFEHLLDGAGLLADIIRGAPGVTLLVTSRERLRLQAEWLVELGGLDYPEGGASQNLEAYAALSLFAQRARQVQPGFTLNGEEARAAAHICQMVEGMPLAIELAAASVRHRSCTTLAAEMESDLGALAAATRDMPERHRSMRAAFEQSWRLLSEEEQQVFARLSVFRGGFDEEAAGQITGATPQVLFGLLDKSLLRREPGERRESGERYDLHELLRQYAAAKLEEAGALEQTRDGHLSFFVALAEQAELQLRGKEQRRWSDRLERTHDNLTTALGWALESGKLNSAGQLAFGIWYFWYLHDRLATVGRHWLKRVLESAPELPPKIRGSLLYGAGGLAYIQGDYASAKDQAEEALAIRRELGDKRDIATVLQLLGLITREEPEPDYERTRMLYEESLALTRALGDEIAMSNSLNGLASICVDQGDYENAARLLEECRALSQNQDSQNMAITITNLGWLALIQGEAGRAAHYCAEGLRLFHRYKHQRGVGYCLVGMGGTAAAQNRPVRAARLFGAAEALREALKIPLEPSNQRFHDHFLAPARAGLDEAAFLAAWAEGRALSPDEAIAYALDEGQV